MSIIFNYQKKKKKATEVLQTKSIDKTRKKFARSLNCKQLRDFRPSSAIKDCWDTEDSYLDNLTVQSRTLRLHLSTEITGHLEATDQERTQELVLKLGESTCEVAVSKLSHLGNNLPLPEDSYTTWPFLSHLLCNSSSVDLCPHVTLSALPTCATCQLRHTTADLYSSTTQQWPIWMSPPTPIQSPLSSTDTLSWDATCHEGIDQHSMITVRKGKREKGCEGWKKFHLSPLKTLEKDLMQDQHSHDSSFVPEWMDRHVSIQQRACSSSSSKQPLYWTQVICFLFLVCTYTLHHAHMFGRKYS